MIKLEYHEHIGAALDYIEDNLCGELTLARIACAAGYSEYHFLRIFREATGLTPADYIRKRRLSEIVRRMQRLRMMNEDRPASEIAFEFGFNSKENFLRAFKAEHHILPTEFRKAGNSLKLYDRIRFDPPPIQAEGRVLKLDAFELIVYPSDEDYAPNFWNKYNAKKWSEKLSGGKIAEDFGVCKWNETAQKLDYYIGIRRSDVRGDLSGTVMLPIPGGLYAVFDTPPSTPFDFVNAIHRTWRYIGRVWLPQNGYRRTGGYELESYVEQSRAFSERIYIPVEKESQ